MSRKFIENNFNIIRLLAAIEVLIAHMVEVLKFDLFHPFFFKLIFLFPGVPIFFFISGFLISRSYENNNNIFDYSRNRILRIYPALIICTIISIIAVIAVGYICVGNIGYFELGKLFLSQITIVQFYHPEYMRYYGDGVLNGSLWSITVELQFYFLMPIIYKFIEIRHNNSKSNFKIILLILFFLIINLTYWYFRKKIGNVFFMKIFFVSFLPWFYMFLTGVLFQINFEKIYNLFAGKFPLLFILYSLIATFLVDVFHFHHSNTINPILFFFLCCLIFSFAYSMTSLSKNILGNIDMSYGIYIYHMPIINFIVYHRYTGEIRYIFLIVSLLFFSYFSWKIIEFPCIKLKKHPLFSLNKTT